MRRVVSLVLAGCIFFGLLSGSASAGTTVSGVITTDTTWNLAGSPYTFATTIGVDRDATLIIEPGVEVIATPEQPEQQLAFQVAGELVVSGTVSSPVRFSCTWASLRCWRGLEFVQGSDGIVDHALVEFASVGIQFPFQSTATVTNSTLRFNANGHMTGPNSTMTDSRLIWNGRGSIQGVGNFTRNLVTGNQEGGLTEMYWGPPVHGNAIYGNGSSGYVRDMTVYMPSSETFDATGNWWGTTDSAEIEANIWDHSDDLSNATEIIFDPFLTAPPGDVPDLPEIEQWLGVGVQLPDKLTEGDSTSVPWSMQQLGPSPCGTGFQEGQVLLKARPVSDPASEPTTISTTYFVEGQELWLEGLHENSMVWLEVHHTVLFCDGASDPVLVQVAPEVTLKAPKQASHGAKLSVSGSIHPLLSDSTIKIQRKTKRGWVTRATATTDSDGGYRTKVRAPSSGTRLRLRALFSGDASHASSASPTSVVKLSETSTVSDAH